MTSTATLRPTIALQNLDPVDTSLLGLGGLAVVDSVSQTSFLDIPMVMLGALAIYLHFAHPSLPGYQPQLRRIAVLAAIGIASASLAVSFDAGSLTRPETRLILGWLYWLALFVVVAERAADRTFRRSLVASIGFAATAVAAARIAEVVVLQNVSSPAPFLMSRNGYGAVLAVLAPLAIVTWDRRSQSAAWAAAALFILALTVNGSRGSLIAAIAWLLVFAVGFRRSETAHRRTILLVGSLVVLIAVGVATATIDELSPVRERILTLQNLEQDTSATARVALQQKAFAIIADSPLFGVGAGNFTATGLGAESALQLAPRYWSDFPTWNAHNSYLELLSEVGIIGAVTVLLIVGGTATTALIAVPNLRIPSEVVTLGIAGSVLTLAAYLFLIGGIGTTTSWLLLGLWAAAYHDRRMHGSMGTPTSELDTTTWRTSH